MRTGAENSSNAWEEANFARECITSNGAGLTPDHAKAGAAAKTGKFLRRGKTWTPSTRILNAWFDKHDAIIPRQGSEAVASLSCMFPECRVDRVYNLREAKLEAIV
jgi:hypothetical protein